MLQQPQPQRPTQGKVLVLVLVLIVSRLRMMGRRASTSKKRGREKKRGEKKHKYSWMSCVVQVDWISVPSCVSSSPRNISVLRVGNATIAIVDRTVLVARIF